jgi:hypothetical protein
MKFTITKIAVAAALALASTGALAVTVGFDGPGVFEMYDPEGAFVGGATDVTGFVDYDAMTFGVASTTAFFGLNWTASGGVLYNPGTYTVNVNGDGADADPGFEEVTFTVGAGQVGGNINFAWDVATGMDVFMVWDLTDTGGGDYVSTDFDGDGIPGKGMVDGPLAGFSVNFNFNSPAPIPEASTYGMMLAGLGLVGFAVRRRKLMA